MTGSVAIDVVIALIFIYLLYSLLATIIQELIASYISLRATYLEKAIRRMLDDDTGNDHFSKEFYHNPVIKYLAEVKKKPSYITAQNFSKVVVDILKGSDPLPGDDFAARIRTSLTNGFTLPVANVKVNSGDTYRYIQSLWADAHGDIDRFRANLEQWFNDTMDRASGWYKKRTQTILFFIGLGLAIIFNVDTIKISGKLSSNPRLTAQLVQQADNFLKAHPNLTEELDRQKKDIEVLTRMDTTLNKDSLMAQAERHNKALRAQQQMLLSKADTLIKADIKNVNSLLGIGINHYKIEGSCLREKSGFVMLSLLGWVITALAISLGAPFWFDLLNKLMKLRSSIAAAGNDTDDDNKTATPAATINPKG